jgi:proline dehydrogenase
MTQLDNTEIAFRYRSDKDLKLGRFLFSSMKSPLLTSIGIAATKFSIKAHIPIGGLIKRTIFRQFCGGETMVEAADTANVIGKYHVGVILDYGVEGKENEKEFDKATAEFIKAIDFAAAQPNMPFVSLKVTGFARFDLLEKINNGEKLTLNESTEWQRVHNRIERICTEAFQKGVMILIDAEETWIVEPVNELTEKMMEQFNKKRVVVFNTYQFYCSGTLPFLKDSCEKAASKGYILGAKLVRGAYMEKERARAAKKGYADPIQPDKQSTDRDYDAAVEYCLQNLDKLALFIGTHNEKSCLDAVKYMREHKLAPGNPNVYFSQLYGMGDNISFNLAHEGYNVSKYLPYGPVEDVIPYLMRRAQENTSVAGQTTRELELIDKEIKRRASVHH